MPVPVTAAAALAGRLLLAAIFLHEAWSKLTGYSAALAYMQAFGVPGQLLPLAIAVELGCGVLILCGYHTRAAALLLAGFCLVTAVLFHTKFGDRNQLLHFEKDLAIAGGLLVLFAHGATSPAHAGAERLVPPTCSVSLPPSMTMIAPLAGLAENEMSGMPRPVRSMVSPAWYTTASGCTVTYCTCGVRRPCTRTSAAPATVAESGPTWKR